MDIKSLPLPVTRALRKLGSDINEARRRRRIPGKILAQRASMSRTTLVKVEKGDPTVAFGNVATVLYLLGLTDRLAVLADPGADSLGLQMATEHLPQRVRLPGGKRKKKV
jgi:hypothetical protein